MTPPRLADRFHSPPSRSQSVETRRPIVIAVLAAVIAAALICGARRCPGGDRARPEISAGHVRGRRASHVHTAFRARPHRAGAGASPIEAAPARILLPAPARLRTDSRAVPAHRPKPRRSTGANPCDDAPGTGTDSSGRASGATCAVATPPRQSHAGCRPLRTATAERLAAQEVKQQPAPRRRHQPLAPPPPALVAGHTSTRAPLRHPSASPPAASPVETDEGDHTPRDPYLRSRRSKQEHRVVSLGAAEPLTLGRNGADE